MDATPRPPGIDLLPDETTIWKGWSRLTTGTNGDIPERATYPHGPLRAAHAFGFFVANTRLLSRYRILLDGETPERALAGSVAADAWFGTFRKPGSTTDGDVEEGSVPPGALELRIARRVSRGMREEWWLENHDISPRAVTLVLEVEARIEDELVSLNGADESKVIPWIPGASGRSVRAERTFGARTHTAQAIEHGGDGITAHPGEIVTRAITITLEDVDEETTRIDAGERGLRLVVQVPARGRWRVAILYEATIDGDLFEAPDSALPVDARQEDPTIRCGNAVVETIARRAQADLAALALPRPDGRGPSTLAAGVPAYLGLFGRDSLAASWQGSLLSRRWMLPALERLRALQSFEVDPSRGAEPGKLPHERRLSPASAVGRGHSELYYGDIVGAPFWVVTLGAAQNWSGEKLDRKQLECAQRCIDWVERSMERGQGFVWDVRGPGDPARNHGWKDSGDGIVDGRGRVRVPPLALVEEQGYCHAALQVWAALLLVRGHALRSRHYRKLARELRHRFEEKFWMERKGTYALALDREGGQVDSVSSNAGHVLGCGIARHDRARRVADRLLAPDMFSGWGVRTLSADNPAYDPFSYHRGSVWPVDNATIAASIALHGFESHAERIIEGTFRAAECFGGGRLPEVFGGQPRDREHPLPGLYPNANPIQAWSASGVGLMLQTLLGIRAFAQLNLLLVRPRLPEWLPWVRIDDLRVGAASIDLHFWRTPEGRSKWKVARRSGTLHVLEQPSAQMPHSGIGWRAALALRSLLPRHSALPPE